MSIVSSDHPTKTTKFMDFEDFKDLAPTRHTFHDVYTLHGLFHKMSADYYLIDFGNTDFGLPVYYKSYLPGHIALLDDSLSECIDLTFAWVQTDTGPVLLNGEGWQQYSEALHYHKATLISEPNDFIVLAIGSTIWSSGYRQ